MASTDPAGPRVSLRRVVLLLLFGASACMALTDPGRWVASKLVPHRGLAWAPIFLKTAPHSERIELELMRSFEDLDDGGVHPVGTMPVPTDELIAQRLGPLEGWTTCVVLELGSSPEQLLAAGLEDREACVAISQGGSRWLSSPAKREQELQFPWRNFDVLLLDAQGRRLGGTVIQSLRPGFVLLDADRREYAERPDAPGDGALPAVRIFHRGPAGEVVRG